MANTSAPLGAVDAPRHISLVELTTGEPPSGGGASFVVDRVDRGDRTPPSSPRPTSPSPGLFPPRAATLTPGTVSEAARPESSLGPEFYCPESHFLLTRAVIDLFGDSYQPHEIGQDGKPVAGTGVNTATLLQPRPDYPTRDFIKRFLLREAAPEQAFVCPITKTVPPFDPVYWMSSQSGVDADSVVDEHHVYEREESKTHLTTSNLSPVSRKALPARVKLVPHGVIRHYMARSGIEVAAHRGNEEIRVYVPAPPQQQPQIHQQPVNQQQPAAPQPPQQWGWRAALGLATLGVYIAGGLVIGGVVGGILGAKGRSREIQRAREQGLPTPFYDPIVPVVVGALFGLCAEVVGIVVYGCVAVACCRHSVPHRNPA